MSQIEPGDREEMLLAGILNGDTETNIEPGSRKEMLLKAILEAGLGDDLPEVSGSDDGKVLAVVDGEWDKATIPSGNLPPVSASDNGKVLSVENGEWGVSPNDVFITSVSPNLLNPSEFNSSKAINSSGILANNTSGSSNPINVEGAEKISIYAPADNSSSKTHKYSFASDNLFTNQSVIDHGTFTVKSKADSPESSIVVLTVPEGAKYFAFGFNNETQRNFVAGLSNPYAQVQIGETITDWRAYGAADTYLADIVQSVGNDSHKVISQKAVTDLFAQKEGKNLREYSLENKNVHEYLANADYTSDTSYSTSVAGTYCATANKHYSGANRLDQPAPVRIVFDNTKDGVGNIVTGVWVTDGNSFDTYKFFKAQNGYAEIYNLVPNKNYKYRVYGFDETFDDVVLEESDFATDEGVRMCYVKGLENVRDLGGWTGLNSKATKYGKIYRGCEFYVDLATDPSGVHIYPEGIDVCRNILGIKAELDMTGVTHTESALGADIEFEQIMIGAYAPVVTNSTYQGYFKDILEWIVTQLTASKPVYMHCQGGVDRTGTVSALLLGLLGVSENDMSKEYELSSFSKVGYYRKRNSTYPDGNDYKSLITALKTYDSNINTAIYTWATTICNIDAQTISDFRDLMLEA